jgi:hypothetical protein
VQGERELLNGWSPVRHDPGFDQPTWRSAVVRGLPAFLRSVSGRARRRSRTVPLRAGRRRGIAGSPSKGSTVWDETGAKALELHVRGGRNGDAEIACMKCTGVIDRTKNQVIVTAPITSLASAMGIKAGSKLTGLCMVAQRHVGFLSLTSDEAAAPEGLVFKV